MQHRGKAGGAQWIPLVKEPELRVRGRTSSLQLAGQSTEENKTGQRENSGGLKRILSGIQQSTTQCVQERKLLKATDISKDFK